MAACFCKPIGWLVRMMPRGVRFISFHADSPDSFRWQTALSLAFRSFQETVGWGEADGTITLVDCGIVKRAVVFDITSLYPRAKLRFKPLTSYVKEFKL